MGEQLSLKAAIPLVEILATCRKNVSNTGPWPASSHYLIQCWNLVRWTLRNKFKWNLNQNSHIFIQENAIENVVRKMATICLGLNVLRGQIIGRYHFDYAVDYIPASGLEMLIMNYDKNDNEKHTNGHLHALIKRLNFRSYSHTLWTLKNIWTAFCTVYVLASWRFWRFSLVCVTGLGMFLHHYHKGMHISTE